MAEVIYSFQEFAKQHGGRPLRLRGQLLFPDGARSDISDMIRHDPPANAYERLTLQREYAAEVLRRRVQYFQRMQAALTGQGEPFTWPSGDLPEPPPGHDGVAALEFLKQLTEQAHARLTEIDRELAETPEAQRHLRMKAHEEEMAREEERRNRDLAAAAAKVKLSF